MPWTEISNRAEQFCKKWQGRLMEKGAGFLEIANTQTFYDEFFEVFGQDRSRVANYEENVWLKDREDRHPKRVDLLWPGVLLVEQKPSWRWQEPGCCLRSSHEMCGKSLQE